MPQSETATAARSVRRMTWVAGNILLTLCKLPFWLLYFISKDLRQHSGWTYRQAIANELMRAFLYNSSILETKTPLSLEPGAEGELFVQMAPSGPRFYRGVLDDPTIRPCVIGGTWFPAPPNPRSDVARNTVLYFHGGAFVIGDGRLAVSGFAAATLAQAFDAKVLSFSYRLSSGPDGRFPAALQDAVTAYAYLLGREGVDASRVILAGDSAGCNLAISLLRYIADHNDDDDDDGSALLPTPLAAVLCSPWVDVSSALDPANEQRHKKVPADYVPAILQRWGARTYVPKDGDPDDPYISPARQPFRTKTAVWICVGGSEVLRDEGTDFAERMRKEGNRVEAYIEPCANHAILGVGNVTGFANEARAAMKRAAGWILEKQKLT